MQWKSSGSSQQAAAQAAERLIGFYPTMGASNPEIFLAGLVELFCTYPPWILARVPSAVSGIPSQVRTFCPAIAQVKEICDIWMEEAAKKADFERRFGGTRLLPAPREPFRPERYPATRSGLCAKYDLQAIPPGWGAIEVAQASAKYGDRLPAVVDEMLLAPSGTEPKSVFADVVEHAREAMGQHTEVAE